MKNAECFIAEQENLIKEDRLKKEHILEVNKQWDKIERHLDTYKISPEDKYIVFKEPILEENIDKLKEFGFFIDNSKFISKIYLKKEDYDHDKGIYYDNDLIELENNIYNIHDEAHENSRVDNVYNREKSKKDMNKVLNKSNEDKKDSLKKLNDKLSKLTSVYNYYNIFGFDDISREIFKLNNIDISKINNEINKCVEEIELLEKDLGINKPLMNE